MTTQPIDNCYQALVEAISHLKTHSTTIHVKPETWQTFNEDSTPCVSINKPKKEEKNILQEAIPSHISSVIMTPHQSSTVPPAEILNENFSLLSHAIEHCQRCELCHKCAQPIPGMGGEHANILWIGDTPTENDDKTHSLLQDQAGLLLSKMITAMQLDESQHYITTIIKCFPGKNTPPAQAHIDGCLDFLHRQIAIIKPKVIILLGYTAVLHTIKGNIPKSDTMVGKWLELDGVPAMPIYSPAFLVRLERGRDPTGLREKKMQTWIALQEVMHHLANS